MGLVLALKTLFVALAMAGAVSYRAKHGVRAPVLWYYTVLPLALGSPLVFAPLPVYLWTVAAWGAGIWPARLIARHHLDRHLPWQHWFGSSKLLRGSRLATAVEVAWLVRSLYAKGKRHERDDTPVEALAANISSGPMKRHVRLLPQTPAWKAICQIAGIPIRDDFSRINLGGVPIPRGLEPSHFFLVGTTGGGKSVALKTILDQADAAGQRVIAMDNSADLASRYYDAARGDLILNPFDSRCVPWSPLCEIRNDADAADIAASICPTGEGADKTWTIAAQNFLGAIFVKLLDHPNPTNRDFLHWALVASPEDLRDFLKGTPAAPYVAEGNERMFGSVRATAAERVTILAALPPEASRDHGFSIRDWIREDGGSWLFCTYRADQLKALRFFLATIVDIASTAALSLEQSFTRRLFVSIDEWDSIGKVDSIGLSILAQGRKFGLCLIAAIQSSNALFKTNGQENAKSMLANFNTWLVLRSPESSSASLCSDVFGKGDFERRTHQVSHSKGGAGVSSGAQIERDVPAVSVSEIQNLPAASAETGTPPEAYLKLGGSTPVCRITLSFPPARAPRDGYIPHPNLADRRRRAQLASQVAMQFRSSGETKSDSLMEAIATLNAATDAEADSNSAPSERGPSVAPKDRDDAKAAEQAQKHAAGSVAGLDALDALAALLEPTQAP